MQNSWNLKGRLKDIGAVALIFFYSTFLLSAIVLVSTILLPLMSGKKTHEFGVLGQQLSVPTFTFPDQRKKIRSFASSCNLSPDSSRRIVIDDLTYFAFDNLKEPIHLVYVGPYGMGGDIKDGELIPMLRRLGSPGAIAQCAFFPIEFKNNGALSFENLCCIKFESVDAKK
jgi:hypothetical protein